MSGRAKASDAIQLDRGLRRHIAAIRQCSNILLVDVTIHACKQNIDISIPIFNILINFLTLSLCSSGIMVILTFWTVFLCFELLSWPKIKI